MAPQENARTVRLVLICGGVLIAVIFAYWLGTKDVRRTNAQQVSWNYRGIICDDAYQSEKSYAKQNPPSIAIDLNEVSHSCFSGYITVPGSWKSWRVQMKGDSQDDWVAMWYAGWPKPWGPKSGQYLNSQLANDPGYETTSDRLRVEGHGTLLLYRITGDENPTPQDTAADNKTDPTTSAPAVSRTPDESARVPDAPSAPMPDPRPARALMHLAPAEGQPEHFSLYLEECHHAAQKIFCTGKVTNVSDEVYRFTFGSNWVIVDDKGNSLSGNDSHFGSHDLISNVPLNFTFDIDEPHLGVSTINLMIVGGHMQGIGGPPSGGDGYHHLTFSNVPVQ